MSIRVGISFSGDPVIALLANLSKQVIGPIIRKAVRAPLIIYKTEAKADISTLIGGEMGRLIAHSLQLRVSKGRKKGQYKMHVRPKPGVPEFHSTSKAGKVSYIPAAIEYGHPFAAPIPAMRKAFMSSRSDMERAMKTVLKEEIGAVI